MSENSKFVNVNNDNKRVYEGGSITYRKNEWTLIDAGNDAYYLMNAQYETYMRATKYFGGFTYNREIWADNTNKGDESKWKIKFNGDYACLKNVKYDEYLSLSKTTDNLKLDAVCDESSEKF